MLVNECTLREGEQSALVNFRPTRRSDIARRMASAGIRQIQVGYPGLSPPTSAVLRTLKEGASNAALEAVVLGYLPNWREQVQAADRGERGRGEPRVT